MQGPSSPLDRYGHTPMMGSMSSPPAERMGHAGGSVELHQREIIRIHELWSKAKSELQAKSTEIDQLRGRWVGG